MKNIAIIGGSGAAGVVSGLGIKEEELTTCFNVETQALDYMKFQHGDINVVFALRHGKEHTKDPARIKPKYLAKQLSKLVNPEETLVVQTSASGSLDVDIDLVDEGGIVVCDSVMRGFGFRGSSRSIVDPKIVHAVIDNAYSERARELGVNAVRSVRGAIAYDGGVYVENEGNRFETKEEIADLYCRLDTPRFRLQSLERERAICDYLDGLNRGEHSDPLWHKFRMGDGRVTDNDRLTKEIEKYQRMSENLSVKYAQVSMNAAKEIEPLMESGFKDVVLLAFPVNYGKGLIPDEQVDHARTEEAIANATEPYIVSTLMNMIEMAPRYIK